MTPLLAALLALPAPALRAADALPIHPVFDRGCDSPVDLRTGSMAHVEPRSQARENDCYAEAASQLVDAWRFSHGDSNYAHQTSGIALALQTNSDFLGTGLARPEIRLPFLDVTDTAPYAWGEACMAVDTAVSRGSCDARAVLSSLEGMDLSGTIAALRRYYDDYQAWREEHDTLRESIRVTVSGGDSKRTLTARALAARLSSLRSGLRVPEAELGPLLDEGAVIRYLDGVMTYACPRGHTASLSGIDCVRIPFASSVEAHLRLLDRLRRTGQPIAIGFCQAVLLRGRALEEDATVGPLPALARSIHPSSNNHQALVVGLRRHPDTGKCQYLVRNSFGRDCSRYSGDWQCESGSVWVDAQNLAYNTFVANALE